MRNGNSGDMTINDMTLEVLILPMRNGNLLVYNSTKLPISVLILPMRNGNTSRQIPLPKMKSFLSYL